MAKELLVEALGELGRIIKSDKPNSDENENQSLSIPKFWIRILIWFLKFIISILEDLLKKEK